MTGTELLKNKLLDLVASSKNQRLRPSEAKRVLARELDISGLAVHEVVKDLVEEGDLVYSYRDPCSYVEIPCNGCEGGYRAARPMHVVTDTAGNPWLCDAGSVPVGDLPGHGCWDCGTLNFTRTG